jgi:hypothetical protein
MRLRVLLRSRERQHGLGGRVARTRHPAELSSSNSGKSVRRKTILYASTTRPKHLNRCAPLLSSHRTILLSVCPFSYPDAARKVSRAPGLRSREQFGNQLIRGMCTLNKCHGRHFELLMYYSRRRYLAVWSYVEHDDPVENVVGSFAVREKFSKDR